MAEVFVIEVQVTPPSVEDSHRNTLPACPLRVRVPLLEPAHADALPETLPPTVGGATVIVPAEEFCDVQDPLFTTARYIVVVVRLE